MYKLLYISHMKKYLFSVFIFTFSFSFSQNLIPNGDFELGPDSTSLGWCCRYDNSCILVGSVAGPNSWTVVNGSPDRLIEADPLCDYDLDTAQSGISYTVFIYDEAGKTALSMPLQKDSTYQLQYYASLESFQGISTQPSRIQFKFNNNGNIIMSDFITTLDWMHFDTIFTASANSTELEVWGVEQTISGIKLDNFSLLKYYITDIGFTNKNEDGITLFPNPANDFINITLKEKVMVLSLMNSLGEKLNVEKNKLANNCIRVKVSDLPKGLYTVLIQTENRKIITTKFLKHF